MMLQESELKTGDILHCRSNGFLGKAIRKLTKQSTNHTAIAIEIWGQIMVMDAQKDGFNLRSLKHWVDKYDYEVIIARKDRPDINAWCHLALSKAGATPYDFESLIIRHPIEILTGKWRKRTDKKEAKRMVCSEVVAFIEGIERYYNVTPGDLYDYTQNPYHFFSHYHYVKK